MANIKAQPQLKHHGKNVGYYEQMLKLLRKRELEAPLHKFRKQIIDSQNRMSYQNEYDRVRGYLNSHSILCASAKEQLLKRKAFLNSLGATDTDALQ